MIPLEMLFLNKSSFLTPDRLEKLNSIGFVWSVRGESSSTTEKDKGESTTVSLVDTINMVKPAGTEQEGEETALKAVKDEENAAAATAPAAATDGETATV